MPESVTSNRPRPAATGAIPAIDPTHGKVDGQFTLKGKTAPLAFDVELMGAGKGFGHPRIGIKATTKIDPRALGLSPLLGASILLVVDAEFAEGF